MGCLTGQHNWILHDEKADSNWVYPIKRGFFTKQLKEPSVGGMMDGDYITWRVRYTWYCSKCREFDETVVTLKSQDDYLKQGYAIYDYKNDKYIMPTLSRKEALRD